MNPSDIATVPQLVPHVCDGFWLALFVVPLSISIFAALVLVSGALYNHSRRFAMELRSHRRATATPFQKDTETL